MTAPNLNNVKQALDTVQHSLDLFDNKEMLQEGLDLWCFAPRMLALLKEYTAVKNPLDIAMCNKKAFELIAHIES